MIRELRIKFIVIQMSDAASILLAVFAAMFFSTYVNSHNMNENMLSQALNIPDDMPPPQDNAGYPDAFPRGGRMSLLIGEIDPDGNMVVVTNQLYFLSEREAQSAIEAAIETGKPGGTMNDEGLRWRISEDGRRIAMTDISTEQEMLKNLVINSLLIGVMSLAAFFVISLFLSRWAVRPVAWAWERQRQFVADASHELKTPLTVILSNADMLKGAFADEKKARRIDHIRAEAVLMKKLVEDLLTLAKSDSVEREKVCESVDFSFIVTNTILTFEPIIYSESKTLSYDICDGILVTGDTQRLQQLVSILLDNAAKYCPNGGKIDVNLKQAEKKTALLTMTNEGEPIPQNEISQVFERFYRVDKARSMQGSFGLGLSIAQNIVAEHQGKIWAVSDKEIGIQFHVRLPLS